MSCTVVVLLNKHEPSFEKLGKNSIVEVTFPSGSIRQEENNWKIINVDNNSYDLLIFWKVSTDRKRKTPTSSRRTFHVGMLENKHIWSELIQEVLDNTSNATKYAGSFPRPINFQWNGGTEESIHHIRTVSNRKANQTWQRECEIYRAERSHRKEKKLCWGELRAEVEDDP